MKFRKLISAITMMAVAGTMMVGCSGGDNSSTTSSGSGNAPANSSTPAQDNGGAGAKDVTLTVWSAQESQTLLKEMCEEFAKANPDKNYTFKYGVVSEADAKTEVLKDPSAAADVFNFASDQTGELVSAGALYKVTKNKDEIIANNSEPSIAAASVDGNLYAYPLVSDTYFLYYDKSKLTEKNVQSMESILEANAGGTATTVKTALAFDLDNGWYQSSFFFGAGCKLFGEDGTDPTQCDFNNERGLLVGEYLIDLAANPMFGSNFDDGLIKAGFADGTLASAVSGAWNAADIQASLGENFACTKLPTITLSNGETVQMGGMANFKLVGVNSTTKNPLDAMALAEWLTNYDNQLRNFDERSFSPTNTKLISDSAKMSSNPVVAAVANQAQYATLQTSIPQAGNYWTPAEAFGAGIISGEVNKDNLQQKLDQYVESVLSSLN